MILVRAAFFAECKIPVILLEGFDCFAGHAVICRAVRGQGNDIVHAGFRIKPDAEHAFSEEKLTIKLALSDMKEGLVYLKQKKAILALMVCALFINFFVSPIWGNFVPYFIKTDIAQAPSYLFDRLLTPELWSSVFSVLIGISSLVASVILSAKKQEDKVGHKIAVLLAAIAGLMIVMTGGYYGFASGKSSINLFLIMFCIGVFVIGYILPCINIPISTAFMRIIDRDKLSKVGSISSVLSQGLIPIATALAGVVLQYFGSTVLLLICTAGFAATAIFMLFSREVKNV